MRTILRTLEVGKFGVGGVRTLREKFLGPNWFRDNTANFCTIVNERRRIRIAIMNADTGAGTQDKVPQNRCRKGPNSERSAAQNVSLLPGVDWPILTRKEAGIAENGLTTWHLCIYISEAEVRAELSLLTEFSAGYFINFHEKVVLIGPGEWTAFELPSDTDGEPEFEINVERK